MCTRYSRVQIVGLAALLGAALALASIYYSFRMMGSLGANLVEFIGMNFLAGAIFVCAVYLVEHYRCGHWGLGIILGGALLFRLLLLPMWPSLSQDLYRYRWQGRAQQEGLNPYTVTPATPSLEHLRDETYQLMGTKDLLSVYPPLTEQLFAWIFRLTPSVVGFKSLFVMFDLASVVVLLLLLKTRRLPLERVIIYAWNPLVITSFAASGHYDSVAIFTLLLALLFMVGRKPMLSTGLLAFSTLTKFFSILLFPALLKRVFESRQRADTISGRIFWFWHGAKYAVFFALLIGLPFLLYAPVGTGTIFEGLDHFVNNYENNDSLFRIIRFCGNSHMQAQLVAGVFVIALLIRALKKWADPLKIALLMTAAIVLFSPNSFPWYFTWSIPFLCFYPNSPGLLMSITATLGYAPLVEYNALGSYNDSQLFLWLEYGPVFALGAGLLFLRQIMPGRDLSLHSKAG